MNLELNGKLALVSGSTAGIGHAIAAALVREGAQVIVNGRTQDAVDRAVGELAKLGDAGVKGFGGDLATAEAAEAVVTRFPGIDILINNLGIFESKPFEDIPDADWRRFFDVNVLGGVRLARLCLPSMRQRNWGRIIFVSSESGLQIPAEMVHYGVTKAAQIAAARGIAETLAGTGITVNSVLPGPTKSRGVVDFVAALPESQGKSFEQFETEFFQTVRPTSLIKRFAQPEEIASMVAYLASPLSAAINGSALRVDGGVVKSAF